MAIAAPTPATLTAARRYSPWQLWHLLSLDAPTIAALWTIFFAAAARIRLPWIAPLAMATGVWVLYALDRILDSRSAESGRTHPRHLRERHIFHARHRRSFIAIAAIVLPAVLFLAFRLAAFNARRDMLLLSLAVAAYLLFIHTFSPAAQHRLPKELVVGVIFATATLIPTWARAISGRAPLFLGAALFAALCWLNCVAIEAWESNPRQLDPQHAHPSTAWASKRLSAVSIALSLVAALAAIAATFCSGIADALAPIAAACALSAAALALLHSGRNRISADNLRVAADAALLTPLLVLPFLK